MSELFENILASAKTKTDSSIKEIKGDDLELIGEEVEDWKDIPGQGSKKRRFVHYKEKDLASWSTRDFFLFYLDTFLAATGQEYIVGLLPGQQSILLMQDAMAKYAGRRPTPQETKDYIEWFLHGQAVRLLDRYNCFKMKFLSQSFSVENFYASRTVSSASEKRRGMESSIYSDKVMESVYFSNRANFVLKYGLVLSVAWLKKRMNELSAIALVVEDAKALCEQGKYNEIIAATEKLNPYPIRCQFAGLKRMLADLTVETGEFFDIIDTRFSKEVEKFNFLEDKE